MIRQTDMDKLIGEYESDRTYGGGTSKKVLLEDGSMHYYNGGEKIAEGNWSVVNGELHLENGHHIVCSINEDGSITYIANIDEDGKREDNPKNLQSTAIKVK